MSLPLDVRRFVATGYAAALMLEELAAPPHPSFPGMGPVDEAILGVRLASAEDEAAWAALKIHSAFAAWRPQQRESGLVLWGVLADQALAFLKDRIPKAIGPLLRDRIEALLILLLIEQRLQGRRFFLIADYAPWLGVTEAELEEIVRSEALRGIVKLLAEGLETAAQLTVDGQLRAEELVEPDAGVVPPFPIAQQAAAGPLRVAASIERIEIKNLLSFGPESGPIELGRLNVLIGPNGAGKSNLLDAISLLASTPRDLAAAILREGGIHDLLWKGAPPDGLVGGIEAVVGFADRQALRHRIRLSVESARLRVADERIENADAEGRAKPFFFFGYEPQGPMISARDGLRSRHLEPVRIAAPRSILAERRDPERFPEIADLASFYEDIRAFREPLFGKKALARRPQPVDLPNDALLEDGSNLALVLNRLRLDPPRKRRIIERLQSVYEPVRDVDIKVEGGRVQMFLEEETFTLPASRFSDGTLRLLALIVLLSESTPPPLVLIDEPEIGLHPDAIGVIADMLREASERTQVIVTTHSVALVDRFTDTPEDVQVVEKVKGSTQFVRRGREDLKDWLEKFSLGQLWRMGELGGNRW